MSNFVTVKIKDKHLLLAKNQFEILKSETHDNVLKNTTFDKMLHFLSTQLKYPSRKISQTPIFSDVDSVDEELDNKHKSNLLNSIDCLSLEIKIRTKSLMLQLIKLYRIRPLLIIDKDFQYSGLMIRHQIWKGECVTKLTSLPKKFVEMPIADYLGLCNTNNELKVSFRQYVN